MGRTSGASSVGVRVHFLQVTCGPNGSPLSRSVGVVGRKVRVGGRSVDSRTVTLPARGSGTGPVKVSGRCGVVRRPYPPPVVPLPSTGSQGPGVTSRGTTRGRSQGLGEGFFGWTRHSRERPGRIEGLLISDSGAERRRRVD